MHHSTNNGLYFISSSECPVYFPNFLKLAFITFEIGGIIMPLRVCIFLKRPSVFKNHLQPKRDLKIWALKWVESTIHSDPNVWPQITLNFPTHSRTQRPGNESSCGLSPPDSISLGIVVDIVRAPPILGCQRKYRTPS